MTKESLTQLILAAAIAFTSSCSRGGANSRDYSKRLVHDAKSGEYIGVLRGECRLWDKDKSKEIITYKVERSDGSTIELSSEKVTVIEQ